MTVLAALLLCAVSLAAPQQVEKHELPRRVQQAFELLDEVDTLDTRPLPFVRVATGAGFRQRGEPRQNAYRYGFLLGANEQCFTVRYLELDRAVLKPTPPGTAEHSRVGFEPADLRSFASEMADQAMIWRRRSWDAASVWLGARMFDPPGWRAPMTRGTVVLLVARACERSGFPAEAQHLLAQVWSGDTRSLEFHLQRDFAAHLALACSDPANSWPRLLELHEAWLRVYAGDPGLVGRRDAIAALVARPGTRNDPPTDADLLEDLRDLDVPTAVTDRRLRHAAVPPPAHAVKALETLLHRGEAAEAALQAAQDDRSPTRSISNRRGDREFDVRTLGDLARDVQATLNLAAEWHACAQSRSPIELERVAKRTSAATGPDAIAIWARRWPAEVDALVDAAAKTPRAWPRLTILGALLGSTDEAVRSKVRPLVRDEASRPGPSRLDACAMLLASGDDGGYRSIVDDWLGGRDDGADVLDSLDTLLTLGDARVWSGLQQRIVDPVWRRTVADTLACLCREDMLRAVPSAGLEPFERAARACLLPLLDDGTRIGHRTFALRRQRIDLHDASVADVAAFALHSLSPGQFAFDAARSASSRQRQVDALRAQGKDGPPQLRRAQERANRVVDVSIDETAAALDTTAHDALRAFHLAEIDAAGFIAAILAMARCPAAAGKRAVLHLERSGEGDGTRLRASLVAPAIQDSELGCDCTVAGTTIARIGTSLAHRAAHAGLDAVISRALAADPTASVEITLSVRAK